MDVAFRVQARVAWPTIRVYYAAGGDGVADKQMQAPGGGIRNLPHADSPNAPSILLSSNDNKSLRLRLPAAHTLFRPTQVTLIHFHPATQPRTNPAMPRPTDGASPPLACAA